MNQINPNMRPPDGYTFTDGDGHIHRAEGWRVLVQTVTNYRKWNKMPVGNVWEEITLFHCANNPSYCRQSGPRQAVVTATRTENPPHQVVKNKLTQWFTDLIKLKRDKKLPRVDDATAAKRAEICRRCPKQTGLSEVCESCHRGIKMGRKAVLEGQHSRHQNLKHCSALGEDCSISVHIEQAKSANSELPANCWRK